MQQRIVQVCVCRDGTFHLAFNNSQTAYVSLGVRRSLRVRGISDSDWKVWSQHFTSWCLRLAASTWTGYIGQHFKAIERTVHVGLRICCPLHWIAKVGWVQVSSWFCSVKYLLIDFLFVASGIEIPGTDQEKIDQALAWLFAACAWCL